MSDQIPLKKRGDALGEFEPGDVVPVQFGGTGANNAVDARASLGLVNVASTGQYDDLLGKPTLFSGSYNDLSDKPAIPDDSSLVHRIGDEIINGLKTFLQALQVITTTAVTGLFRRTGQSKTGTTNSALQYEIAYTDGTVTTMYFGMASIDGNGYYAVGSSANLAAAATSWQRMNADGSIFFVTGRASDWNPRTNNTYSLGMSTVRWANVYAVNLDVSGSFNFTGDAAAKLAARTGLGVTALLPPNGQQAGFLDAPLKPQATGPYTLTLVDRGQVLVKETTGAVTYTIPTDAGAGWTSGHMIGVAATVAGASVVIQPASGVTLYMVGDTTLTSRSYTVGASGNAVLTRVGANKWQISGAGISPT